MRKMWCSSLGSQVVLSCRKISKNARKKDDTHQLENGDLHHALVKVRRLVFDDLDRDNLVGLDILALDDLAKGALPQDIENEVFAKGDEHMQRKNVHDSLAAVIGTKPVVDVEDIVIVIIIVPVVVGGLAGLCEDPAGVVGGLVAKVGVAEVVGLCDVGGEGAEWLGAR
jgi:hypothetical protein